MKKYTKYSKGGFLFSFFALFFILSSTITVSAQEVNLDEIIKNYASKNPSGNNLPTFSFPNIQQGSTIKGDLSFKLQIPYIQGLTVYILPLDSDIPKATAIAKKSGENFWSITFNSKSVPDDTYFLVAKIKNPSGIYEVSKIKVNINNSQNDPVINQNSVNSWITKINSIDSEKTQQNINAFLESMLTPEWLNQYFHVNICNDKNVCGALADPDNDNLTNVEEFRLGTDPTDPDSDNDGYLDGEEIKNGYNPLKNSPDHSSDKMEFNSPKENGEINADILKVLNAVSSETTGNKNQITLNGKGLPKSFVTLYVYSEMPIIFTVETDDNGNWSYILDKEIESGKHQVYAAITDNTGKVAVKSQPFFFIKTAEAVNVIPPTEASASDASSSVQNHQLLYMIATLILIAITLILALIAIGIRMPHINNIKNDSDQL
jgi:hypothetical protein